MNTECKCFNLSYSLHVEVDLTALRNASFRVSMQYHKARNCDILIYDCINKVLLCSILAGQSFVYHRGQEKIKSQKIIGSWTSKQTLDFKQGFIMKVQTKISFTHIRSGKKYFRAIKWYWLKMNFYFLFKSFNFLTLWFLKTEHSKRNICKSSSTVFNTTFCTQLVTPVKPANHRCTLGFGIGTSFLLSKHHIIVTSQAQKPTGMILYLHNSYSTWAIILL